MSRPLSRTVPFHCPTRTGNEEKSIAEALTSGRISGGGPIAARVEERLQDLLGVNSALLVPTCSHALEMAIRLLQPRPDDEFIVPSFSYVSDANAVLLAGGSVVFADILPDTMTLDPDDVSRRISRRTMGVIAVDYGGYACDLDALGELCEEHGIVLIEDAAHAIGGKFQEKALGTFGDMGCLSFHETKNIHCGEGGALLTSDVRLAELATIYRNRGTNRDAFERGDVDFYSWVGLGSSLFLPELQAAMLDVQLDCLDDVTTRHRAIAALYRRALASLETRGMLRLASPREDCEPNDHVFFVHLPSPDMRPEFIERMGQLGVDTRFHFVPLHTTPFGRSVTEEKVELPATERAAATLVRLPIGCSLTDDDVLYVADSVGRVLQTMTSFA